MSWEPSYSVVPRRSKAKPDSNHARPGNGGQNAKDVSWRLNSRGYVDIYVRIRDGSQIVMRWHKLIAEVAAGRRLLPDEDAHHRDEDKSNNAASNIVILNHAAHTALHQINRVRPRGYRMNLTASERAARSERATSMRLNSLGLAALREAGAL